MDELLMQGDGYNSKVTLFRIHQGTAFFKNDTKTTHPQVMFLQQTLEQMGYDPQGKDGIYGPNTVKAVKQFQSAHGLAVDGIFGINSLLKIESLLGGHLSPVFCLSNTTDILFSIQATIDTLMSDSLNYTYLYSGMSSESKPLAIIPSGSKVHVQNLTGKWIRAQYGEKMGYLSAEYIVETDEYGKTLDRIHHRNNCLEVGTNENVSRSTRRCGKIKCKQYITVRPIPSTTATGLGRLRDGQPVFFYTGEQHRACNGKEFVRIDFDGIGYVLKENVVEDSDQRIVASIVDYNPEAAVSYGYNHTEHSRGSTSCKNHNTSFQYYANQNCANFVSQCLCAGGLPMFCTWSRKIDSVPYSKVGTYNWNNTNASRCALIAKGRLRKINCLEVRKGDVIYVYDSTEQDEYGRYDHVVIAAGDYDPDQKTCNVHGNTANVCNYSLSIDDFRHRCYRVVSPIEVEVSEYSIKLPAVGSGGKVNR